MRLTLFCHSLISDWNHGNAHFLRGIVRELLARGVDVRIFEPMDAWSFRNLEAEHGAAVINRFRRAFPELRSIRYDAAALDIDEAVDGAQVVLVHEWNDAELVRRIGEHRKRYGRYRLLFHDTHHRSVTDVENLSRYDLSGYDGILAFGEVIRERYIAKGWARRAWTWHEAADVRLFRPLSNRPQEGELIWIGNWGDDERSAELGEFLLGPVKSLRIRARVHGVRYPDHARASLAEAGIQYAGWLPNYEAPEAFARFRLTVHVPRRPYVEALPGVPTIRVFEALASGIPLISAPWRDSEGLFAPGQDFLIARDGAEMTGHIRALLDDPDMARYLASNGRRTVLARHTCSHRVDELFAICERINGSL